MASPTFSVRALVLRKTKLGESDLILTLLAEDGSQIRCVAKGARKPTSQFASRLELYAEVDLLCARGRSLDIVKEARLHTGHDALRTSFEGAAGAACMAELLERVTDQGLSAPRLFEATHVALGALEVAGDDARELVVAAHLLKTLAFAGLRPSLSACALCGTPLDVRAQRGSTVRFSFVDGGMVCSACARHAQTLLIDADVLVWAQALLASTFDEILTYRAPASVGASLLKFCQQWTRVHVGASLKSIEFLLTTSFS